MRSDTTYLRQEASPNRPVSGSVDVKWLLLGQIAAADIVLWLFPDLAVRSLGSVPVFGELETGGFGLFWSLPLMLLLMNAFRTIDRLGVGVALVSSIALLLLSLSSNAAVPFAISAGLSLMLVLLLFLGSVSRRLKGIAGMAVGLLLAVTGMAVLHVSSPKVSLPVVLTLFALPVTGVVAAGLRRMLAGRSPFTADDSHFRDVLLSKGVSPSGVGVVMTALSVVFAMLAVCAVYLAVPDAYLYMLLLLLLIFFVLS